MLRFFSFSCLIIFLISNICGRLIEGAPIYSETVTKRNLFTMGSTVLERVDADTNCFFKGFSGPKQNNVLEDRQWSFYQSCLSGGPLTWPSDCIGLTQLNLYVETLDRDWDTNHLLKGLRSVLDSNNEDRLFWSYTCPWANQLEKQSDSCILSDHVNDYDGPFDYQCSSNSGASQFGYISGMYSTYSNLQNDRRWKFRCCNLVPKRCPALLPTLANGVWSCSLYDNVGYLNGSVCTHSCNANLISTDPNGTISCNENVWSTPTFSCLGKDCGAPSNPVDGSYICPFGTTYPNNCSLSCNSGFAPRGSTTVSCTNTGEWIGFGGSCVFTDCGTPTNPSNGVYICPSGTTFPYNCSLKCDTGYSWSRSPNLTCSSAGVWTDYGTCVTTDCGTPINPSNGFYNCSSGTTYLNNCTMTCSSGFDTNGPTALSCLATGTWSTYGTCVAKNCGIPANPSNGYYTCTSGTAFPNTCLMSCNTSYQITGTLTTVTCTNTGAWTGYGASCSLMDCGIPFNPSNGFYNCSSGTIYSKSCSLSCNTGYQKTGSPTTITCTSSGLWTGYGATCLPKNCGTPANPSNGNYICTSGTAYPNTCTLSCNSGFDTSGSTILTCTSSGSWSTYGTCKPSSISTSATFASIDAISSSVVTSVSSVSSISSIAPTTSLLPKSTSSALTTTTSTSTAAFTTVLSSSLSSSLLSSSSSLFTATLATTTASPSSTLSTLSTLLISSDETSLSSTSTFFNVSTSLTGNFATSIAATQSSLTLSSTATSAPSTTLEFSHTVSFGTNGENSTSNIGPVAGAVGGIFALVVVGVAIFVILRKRKQQRNSFYNSESPESTILLHTVSSISNSDPLEENDPNLLITLEANSTVPDNDSSNNYASNTNSDNSKNNNNHIQDTNEAPEKLYLYEDMADTEPVTNSDCNGTSSSSPIYDYATPYAKQVLSHPSIEKDILIDGVIGNGSFGVVKLGRIHNSCVPFYCRDLILKDGKNNYLPCAVKLLKEGSDEKAKRDFSDECKMMANFYHPNVIRVVAVLLDSNPAMLVTEFMKYGDLKRALIISEKKSVLWNEKELLHVALQIAKGMEYLQSIKFIHRDLAARNCLVSDGLTVKISDFGLSKELNEKNYYQLHSKGKLPIRWMAPEALGFRRFTHATDIWSYGVTLWEVFCYAHYPYGALRSVDILAFLERGERLECPKTCLSMPIVYAWMLRCWEYDPANRPSFSESVQFFSTQLSSSKMNSQEIRNIGEML